MKATMVPRPGQAIPAVPGSSLHNIPKSPYGDWDEFDREVGSGTPLSLEIEPNYNWVIITDQRNGRKYRMEANDATVRGMGGWKPHAIYRYQQGSNVPQPGKKMTFDDFLEGRNNPSGEIVHLFYKGSAVCGLPGRPQDWPKGHTRCSDIAGVTCSECNNVILRDSISV